MSLIYSVLSDHCPPKEDGPRPQRIEFSLLGEARWRLREVLPGIDRFDRRQVAIAQLIGSLPRDEAAELGRLADEVAAERMR